MSQALPIDKNNGATSLSEQFADLSTSAQDGSPSSFRGAHRGFSASYSLGSSVGSSSLGSSYEPDSRDWKDDDDLRAGDKPKAKGKHKMSGRQSQNHYRFARTGEKVLHPIPSTSPISTVPHETLSQVLSHLDPLSLLSCSLVNREWCAVVQDDAIWRRAFLIAFDRGSYRSERSSPEGGVGRGVGARRIAPASWKAEYVARTALLRRWRKSRTSTVLSDPRVSSISSISVDFTRSLLFSASLLYGVVSRCDPFTGKVVKGYLDAAGLANGVGNGNPNAEFTPDVAALQMDDEASRIVWGFRAGDVAITTLGKSVVGATAKANVRYMRFSRSAHSDRVTAIAMPFRHEEQAPLSISSKGRVDTTSNTRNRTVLQGDVALSFVTGSADGTVRLWAPSATVNAGSSACVWAASAAPLQLQSGFSSPQVNGPSDPIVPDITHVAFDALSGIIAAGTLSGHIVLWAGLNVSALVDGEGGSTLPSDPSEVRQAGVCGMGRYGQGVGLDRVLCVRIPPPALAAGTEHGWKSVNGLWLDPPRPPHEKGRDALPHTATFALLVHYENDKRLFRYDLSVPPVLAPAPAAPSGPTDGPDPSGACTYATSVLGAGPLAEITCVRPEFSVSASVAHREAVAGLSVAREADPLDAIFGNVPTPAFIRCGSPRGAPSSSASTSITPGASGSGSGAASQTSLAELRPSSPSALMPNEADVKTRTKQKGFAESKFVVAGDKAGRTYIWEWKDPSQADQDFSSSCEKGSRHSAFDLQKDARSGGEEVVEEIPPSLVLEGHMSAVTAIEVTPVLVFTGSLDGLILAHDPLTGMLVRTFNDRAATRHPARMIASGSLAPEDAERWMVGQIVADGENFVASIGGKVLAWRAEKVKSTDRKGKGSKRASTQRIDSKYQLQRDLKSDLHDARVQLDEENLSRQASYEHVRFSNGGADLGGLTEDEAMAYALMLSRDEEEARTRSNPSLMMERVESSYSDGSARVTHPSTSAAASDADNPGMDMEAFGVDDDYDEDDALAEALRLSRRDAERNGEVFEEDYDDEGVFGDL